MKGFCFTMIINQNLNSLGGIYNEANRILNDNVQSTSKTQNKELQQQNQENFGAERITYGMISLELMNDEQYQAFEKSNRGYVSKRKNLCRTNANTSRKS